MPWRFRNLILWMVLLSMVTQGFVLAQDQDSDTSTTTETNQKEATTSETVQSATAEESKPVAKETAAKEEEEEEPAFLAAEPDTWGTYYDPQQEFCGKYDCYRILGFDYENFGSPDVKEITKRYRKLSRRWHPDKSKHPKAKERFVVSP